MTALAIHATSTLLTTDLGFAQLPLAPRVADVPFNFLATPRDPEGSLVSHRYMTDQPGSVSDPWRSRMPTYPTFAEYAEPPLLGLGFVDTGFSARAFLPYAEARVRESIIDFSGPSRVLEAQVVCVQPQADAIVTLAFDDANSVNNAERFLRRQGRPVGPGEIGNLTVSDLPQNFTRNDEDSGLIFGRLSVSGDFGWDRPLPMLALPEGGAYRGRRIDECAIPNPASLIAGKMVHRPDRRLPESEVPLSLCRMQEEYQNITFQTASVKSFLGPDWGELHSDSASVPLTFLVARGDADPALWRSFLISNQSKLNISENGGFSFSRPLRGLPAGNGTWTILEAPDRGPSLGVALCFTSNRVGVRNISMRAGAPRVPEPALAVDVTTNRWNISTLANLLGARVPRRYDLHGSPLQLLPPANWTTPNIHNEFRQFKNCTARCGPGEIAQELSRGNRRKCIICENPDLNPTIPAGSWEHAEFESSAAFPETFDSVYLCSFCGADAGLVQAPSLYRESPPASDARYRVHRAHAALFQGLMRGTAGNLAVALQGVFTTVLQSVYYEYAPSLSMAASATSVATEAMRVPVRWSGLGAVLGIVAVYMVMVAVILAAFWSGDVTSAYLGEKWQAFAQTKRESVVDGILGGVKTERDGDVARIVLRTRGRVLYGMLGAEGESGPKLTSRPEYKS